jgi:hypothetical protein
LSTVSEPARPRGFPPPASLAPRDVFSAAWPLFQVSWPSCLPLAVLGVVASGAPGAETVARGEARGFGHDAQWWGLYIASVVLMLACYGAVLLRQAALAEGRGLRVFDALRTSVLRLPQSAATAALLVAPFAVALALVPASGAAALAAATLGVALLFIYPFAWVAAVVEGASPPAALSRSLALTRGRFTAVAGMVASGYAGVLVFVLLSGILLGVVMSIAGMPGPQGPGQLAVSRVIVAALLAVPVVHLGALWISAWRLLAR